MLEAAGREKRRFEEEQEIEDGINHGCATCFSSTIGGAGRRVKKSAPRPIAADNHDDDREFEQNDRERAGDDQHATRQQRERPFIVAPAEERAREVRPNEQHHATGGRDHAAQNRLDSRDPFEMLEERREDAGDRRARHKETGEGGDDPERPGHLPPDQHRERDHIDAGGEDAEPPEMQVLLRRQPAVLIDEHPLDEELRGRAAAERLEANRRPDAKQLPRAR